MEERERERESDRAKVGQDRQAERTRKKEIYAKTETVTQNRK